VAQELHIQQQGCRGGWLEPVAGRKGRRLRWPHLAVARDAVQRLLTLAPRHERGRELQRYLDATPRRQTATLGRLRFRLLGVERQALKKSERQALTVSLAIENQGDQESPKLSPGAYALHGTGPRPLVASFCQPESPGRLAPGARVEIKLTYAAPAGLRGYAMVLAVPRPRAGALYLQVASDVLP
jgi:hypothetical protein